MLLHEPRRQCGELKDQRGTDTIRLSSMRDLEQSNPQSENRNGDQSQVEDGASLLDG